MATISSSGIGSGLPVESLVSQLMAVERQPITLLDTREAALTAKLTAFGTMKSALATLQTAAKALSTPAQVAPVKATVADPTVLTATATGGTAAGNYAIEVKNLAQAQKLKSTAGFTNTSDPVGTGNITIEFGSYDGANLFQADTTRTAPKPITIDAAHNSLAGLKDAINASNSGVTASIINDGTFNYLSLTSTATGARNAMRITADPALAAITYDGANGGGMSESVKALDANIVVDNVPITKASNTISDAIDGVTLTLTKPTAAGVTTNLALSGDTTAVRTGIEAFVKAYNDAAKSMADLSAFNFATGKGAALNGDSTVRSVQTQLRALMGSVVNGAPAGGATLSSIGIATQNDGSIAIDSAKLTKALADPTKNFSSLLATGPGGRGIASQMDLVLGRILSPVGTLPTHVNSINASIKSIGAQRTTLLGRLDATETRYRTQFSSLDKAMSSMTATSNYLTQQLAALAKNS